MVALFDPKVIGWYLITLKLKVTIEAYPRKPKEKPIARPVHLSMHKSNPCLNSRRKGGGMPWPVVRPPRSPLRLKEKPPPRSPLRQRRPHSPPRKAGQRPPPRPPPSEPWSSPSPSPSPSPFSPSTSPSASPFSPSLSLPWRLPPPDSPWINLIFKKLKKARQYEASSRWETLSIYRVPKSLRDIDQTAYTPKIVSLGPYHRGCYRYRSMDRHKWRSLYHALGRTNHDVRLYLNAARSLEDRARSCYEAPIFISSDAFVESLVLDSIFALELFRGVAGEGFPALGYSPNDPVFAVRGFMPSLQRDMIMLENQLPLFVLDWMLALQLGYDPSSSYRVAPLALRFFEPLKPTYDLLHLTASSDPPYEADSSRALHCLDVFRLSLAAPCPRPSSVVVPLPIADDRPISNEQRQQLIHCVADLRKAGIKFRRGTSDRFWDIKFKDGILYIPPLLIHDGTKSLFLNLIAFEQCHLECGNSITAYVTFMDNLINTEVDVGYLHDKKIIEHWLGNDGEVAAMFNRLCQEVALNRYECYLSELSKQVNRYYHNKWNNWRASFAQKYFSNPWTFISLIAAVFLLLLTAAQTFYTVYPYYKPN